MYHEAFLLVSGTGDLKIIANGVVMEAFTDKIDKTYRPDETF